MFGIVQIGKIPDSGRAFAQEEGCVDIQHSSSLLIAAMSQVLY
jgi:hypothetical protein